MEHLYEYPSVRWLPAGSKPAADAATNQGPAPKAAPSQRELVEATLRLRPYHAARATGAQRPAR
jgi:hypothetical protein